MASAFATGFLAGQRGYQQVLDNDRQKVLDERAAKEFARKEQEWSRADSERAAVDRALGDYADLEKSGTAVGLNTSGFSDGSARMLYGQGGQQGVDEAATYANLENARFGLPRVNQTSQAADPVAAPAPTVGLRPAMRSDRLKALQGVALAKKDVSAAAALGEQLNTAQDDEFVAQALKSYTGAEEQIGSAATYLNNNSKRLTMGAPDKNGFVPLSVVRPDGRAEFLNLTKQDQARLYAAAQLMERNPTRAIEMMAGVNKELATAVAQENGLTSTLTTNANDVANKRGTLGVAQQRANTEEAFRRDSLALQRERINAAGSSASRNLKEFVDDKGNTVVLDLGQLRPGQDGRLPIPAGLRPKTARPEVTQRDIVDYAKALVDSQTPDPDSPRKPLTLDKALVVARSQLAGDGYKSAADRLIDAYMAQRGTPSVNPPASPAAVAPARGLITTIVPPRTAADMAPRQQMSEDDIIRLLAR